MSKRTRLYAGSLSLLERITIGLAFVLCVYGMYIGVAQR